MITNQVERKIRRAFAKLAIDIVIIKHDINDIKKLTEHLLETYRDHHYSFKPRTDYPETYS